MLIDPKVIGENDDNKHAHQSERTSSLQNHFEDDQTSKGVTTIETPPIPPIPVMKENCLSDKIVQSIENKVFSGDNMDSDPNSELNSHPNVE